MINLQQGTMTLFKNQAWIFEIILVTFICLILNWLLGIIYRRLDPKLAKTDRIWDEVLLKSLYKPLSLYIWVLGLGFIIYFLDNVVIKKHLASHIIVYFQFVSEILVIWLGVRFAGRLHSAIVVSPAIGYKKYDKSMAAAFCQLLRIFILIMGILIVLPTLGISISALLAFGGVGTLAIGFAAKDTLANFLGGMMIFVDRPFAVGDWIRSPDRDIEGTVEHIGWRLTRIRRFDMRPLYVPNALFSTVPVENPSRMLNRRIKVNIGVRYQDFSKIPNMLKDIERMLRNHPEIDTNRTLMVNLIETKPSSLTFMIYTYTKTTKWVKYQAILQDVLLKTLDIVYYHGAQCAFPTQTLFIPDGIVLKETEDENV